MQDHWFWETWADMRAWRETSWCEALWWWTDPLGSKLTIETTARKGMRILDLWCGDGKLIPYLDSEDGKYVGIDNSDLIELARLRYQYSSEKALTFHREDMLWWLWFLWDSTFDLALASYCLHFISRSEQFSRFLEQIWAKLSRWWSFVFVGYDEHQSLISRLEEEFGKMWFLQSEIDIDSIPRSIYIKWVKTSS